MIKDQPTPPAAKPEPARAEASAKKSDAAAGPLGEEGSRITRIDAQGNVLVSSPNDIGRGDYGVYNAETGITTLLGNVTITRGPNAVRGQYAVMDLNNNISRVMAAPATTGAPAQRVEGLFVRQDAPSSASAPGAPATATAGQKP